MNPDDRTYVVKAHVSMLYSMSFPMMPLVLRVTESNQRLALAHRNMSGTTHRAKLLLRCCERSTHRVADRRKSASATLDRPR